MERVTGPGDRLGVLGGTFDPIHRAHLLVAAAARDALRLDRVLFIPAGDPWRKHDRSITPARHRLAMVEAALAACGDPDFAVSDAELRRDGPTYTAETLRQLAEEGAAAIWFILGADALMDLPHWHEPSEIIRLARLAVVPRPGRAVDFAALEAAVPGLRAAVDEVPMEPIDLSATALRERIREGGALDSRIPPGAREYIEAHGLYR